MGLVPASFAQQRLWFLDQLEPDNPIYNIPQRIHLCGTLNVEALQLSLSEIVRRHESLRTTFIAIDGLPMQIIAEPFVVPLQLTDLSHLADGEREPEVDRRALEEAAKPFNLQHGPVLRAQLLRRAPDDHILLIVLHHIAGDRWSAGILAEELQALYAAYAKGEPSPLSEMDVQYADFSDWQRGWLQGEELAKQAAYWRKQLADAPAILELPTDRPRPALPSYRGSTEATLLPSQLVDKLTVLSQSEGVTLFMTMLAALQKLLSVYSGQSDIVVGSPIASRNCTEVEPLIGFFVNTLALRTNLEGNPTFRELLARVKETTLAAYTHQDIPFERLVEELQPERSLNYHPIFQVLFALQNAPQSALELAGLTLERQPLHQGTSPFDLSWFATHVADGMQIRIEYSTDIFDVETIRRMLGHFCALLQSTVENPGQHIEDLSLLTADERNEILSSWNATKQDYPRQLCTHHLFEEQAARVPSKVAVRAGTQSLTYAELNARANQVAHHLRGKGAGPGTLVGIKMTRSANMVAALLGVFKSGAAYVPLDPNFPEARIAFILQDAAAKLVLTDEDWQRFDGESIENPKSEVTSDHLAYVLHTSGSTGRPKGVQITHQNLVNFLVSMEREPGLVESDTLLAVTTISFDIAGLEIYLPLVTGATILLASYEEATDANLLLNLLEQESTVLQATPATWRMLLDAGWSSAPKLKALCGGEAFPAELVAQMLPRCGELWNMYGPTETTIWSSVCKLQSVPATTASLGRPIANTTMYVLDGRLQPVPIGVAGALYIGGDGVARGYLNRPELTAQNFIADPFIAGARIYRTGDLARFGVRGDLHYLGRTDSQIKIRGFRVELGEIETVLAQHPGVRECVAAVWDERLIAYFIPSSEVPDSRELRTWVRDRLPEYMTPSAFVELERFPLTPNRKVDRKALPAPELTAAVHEYIAPRTKTEQRLALIWSEVLHIERIGAADNFFALGGHSLLATQVISRIRRDMQVELPLRSIFEAPTLEALAVRFDLLLGASTLGNIAIRLISRDQALPLSFAQQRMWFLDQLDPGQALFNVTFALRVDSELDLELLQRAVDALVARHETLRSNFTSEGGVPAQRIASSLLIPVQYCDLGHLAHDESEAEAMRVVGVEARRPFDLAQDPLLRIFDFQLAEDAHVLLLVIHHIISDRWSITILLRELSALYGAFSEGKRSPLPELPVQFADFAAWQQEPSQIEASEMQLKYWAEELKDAPPLLEMPTDRPRPSVASVRGDVASISLSQALTKRLHELSRNNGTTLFMTLLAGFGVLLSRYSGQDDLIIGLPVASRNRPEVEGLIGLFANTLPVRLRFSEERTFAKFLEYTKDIALAAFAHQDVPFERMVEVLRPDRSLSYDPIVQVYFILQNAPNEGLNLEGLSLKHIETNSKTAKGDLFFSLAERNGGLHGRMEYNTDLFDAASIERLLLHYEVLLEAAVAAPGTPVSQLPMLSLDEREQILVRWNATEVEYPRTLCLHELFEAQALRTPEAVACVFEEKQLTYGDLNARANQLAHTLRSYGVKVGDLVAIFVERSLEMMVGLLGIQKSGAAYVPLDPRYPSDRIRFTLEDSQVALLLTQERLLYSLPPHDAEAICLDRDWPEIALQSCRDHKSGVRPDDLVYVIFTSGTTGRPKGVQVPHRAVVNLMNFMARELEMGSKDVFPALASFAFDMCIPELYLALVSGGRTVIGDYSLAADGEELAAMLRKQGATIVHATPTTWQLLLEAGFTGKGLKRAIGAEPLPRDLCTRLLVEDPSLYNFYGPTETTVWSTVHQFTSKEEPIVIGRPLDNTQVYILDRNLQPVPIGVLGEVYIGGDGVTRGYLHRPDLTAEKFIPNPFSHSASARMYRTGDMGRYLPDGSIEFQGRGDNQVKVRGYRIELGEIESVLGSHASVKDCVVVAREDVAGDRRLVGYVVANDGCLIDRAQLRIFVKERLPDYMVPVAWVEMPRLPLSPNGKVDRKQLPVPDSSGSEGSESYLAPQTPTQEMLASIIGEVLRTERVGLNDNFFEMGGHSLSATQVVARARAIFGVDLSVRALFEAPTVASLSQIIDRLERGKYQTEIPPLVRVARNGAMPLSYAQQRLWFQYAMDPESPLYNVPWAARLTGVLDPKAMEVALQGIVQRHEVLRTTYEMEDDLPVQRVQIEAKVPMEIRDLRELSEQERLSEARRIVEQESARPFNLGIDILFRPILLKLDERDHLLFVNMHHIACDGWSLGVIASDLAVLYEAALTDREFPANTPSALPELPVQYADFAMWQRNWLQGEVLQRQLDYWKQQLDGAPPVLALPTDRPRTGEQSSRGATERVSIDCTLTQSIGQLSRRQGVSSFMTMLAAFQCLILHSTKQHDIVLGTDLAGRTAVETEALVGFFVNLIVLRTNLSQDPTFNQLLVRVRDVTLGAYAHQDVPFDHLVIELQPERKRGHNPLVQVLFVHLNTPRSKCSLPGIEMAGFPFEFPSKFDLVVFCGEKDQSLTETWNYNPDLFDRRTILRMAVQFQLILEQAVGNSDLHLSEILGTLEASQQQEQMEEHRALQETSQQKLRGIKRRPSTSSAEVRG